MNIQKCIEVYCECMSWDEVHRTFDRLRVLCVAEKQTPGFHQKLAQQLKCVIILIGQISCIRRPDRKALYGYFCASNYRVVRNSVFGIKGQPFYGETEVAEVNQ